MRTILLTIGLLALAVTGCTIVNQPPQRPLTPQTQLQTREFQTREYDTNDVKLIMKAVLNTLQDDGFVVKNAVIDLGLLTAEKEIQLSTSRSSSSNNDDFWSGVFEQVFRSSYSNRSRERRDEYRYAKFKRIEASVNVSEIGTRTKVRVNFQAKTLDNNGQPLEVETIADPTFYQQFFAKVDKGIFIQKQGF